MTESKKKKRIIILDYHESPGFIPGLFYDKITMYKCQVVY